MVTVCIVMDSICIEHVVIALKLMALIGRMIVDLAIVDILHYVLFVQPCYTWLAFLPLFSLDCTMLAFHYLL